MSRGCPLASFTPTCNVASLLPGFLTVVTTLLRPAGRLAQKMPEPAADLSPSRRPPLKVKRYGPRGRMPSGRYWSDGRVFQPESLSLGGAAFGSVGGGCQV